MAHHREVGADLAGRRADLAHDLLAPAAVARHRGGAPIADVDVADLDAALGRRAVPVDHAHVAVGRPRGHARRLRIADRLHVERARKKSQSPQNRTAPCAPAGHPRHGREWSRKRVACHPGISQGSISS